MYTASSLIGSIFSRSTNSGPIYSEDCCEGSGLLFSHRNPQSLSEEEGNPISYINMSNTTELDCKGIEPYLVNIGRYLTGLSIEEVGQKARASIRRRA